MNKFIKIGRFMQGLFDDPSTAQKAAEIGQAILAARSLRTSEFAAKMKGSSAASVSSSKPIPGRCCGGFFQSKPSLSLRTRPRWSVHKPRRRRTLARSKTARAKVSGLWCWEPPIVGGRSPVGWSPILRKPLPPTWIGATGTIFEPLRGSKTCWANSPSCWIGSSVTWNSCSIWWKSSSISSPIRTWAATHPSSGTQRGSQWS